jgi:hypothetical protein
MSLLKVGLRTPSPSAAGGVGRLAILLVAFGLGTMTAPPAPAQDDVTVSGEVIDMSCYLSKGSKGSQHKACAQLCAKKGVPIGILTEAGDVYLLIDDHNNPDPYEALKKLAGEQAEVKGKKYSKGGVQSILVVESTGK